MIKVKLFIVMVVTIMMSACEKFPINGKMDGMWKVTSIELSSGETISPYRIFFSIEQHTIQISDKGGNAGTYTGGFMKIDGNIVVSDFINNNSCKVNDAVNLVYFGINELETNFVVVKATSKKMIWASDYATIYFSKF